MSKKAWRENSEVRFRPVATGESSGPGMKFSAVLNEGFDCFTFTRPHKSLPITYVPILLLFIDYVALFSTATITSTKGYMYITCTKFQ